MDREALELLNTFRSEVTARFDRLQGEMLNRFDAVDRRFETVDGRIDSLHNEMLTNFDYVFQRLDAVSVEYRAMNAAVRRLEMR